MSILIIKRMNNHELLASERSAYEILSVTLPASSFFDQRMAEWKALYDEMLSRDLRPIREF
jgi:hypothetical protein